MSFIRTSNLRSLLQRNSIALPFADPAGPCHGLNYDVVKEQI